jgi:hypothetical protein
VCRSLGDDGAVGYPDVSEEHVEQGLELVETVFRGGREVAQDPVPVFSSGDAGEPAGDLLLDLRGAQAAFGIVRCGWDGQVVDEPQDVLLSVAEDFEQGSGLGLAGPVVTGHSREIKRYRRTDQRDCRTRPEAHPLYWIMLFLGSI